MGHRHGFSTQMFGTDQNDMHSSGDPFLHFGASASSPSENRSTFHLRNNSQHLHPNVRVNDFSSPTQVVHAQPNQFIPLSTYSSPHPPAPADSYIVPENHFHHASSSNSTAESNPSEHICHGREHHKRKSPMIPSATERGSSSSACYERQGVNTQHNFWEPFSMPPSRNGPVGGETSQRNVRRRTSFDLNMQVPTPPYSLTNYPPRPSSSRQPTDRFNHVHTSAHGRTLVADPINSSHDANTVPSTAQMGGYHHDTICSRNPGTPQGFHPADAQTRGPCLSYPQGFNPANRDGMGSSLLPQTLRLEEDLNLVAAESQTSRNPRAFASAGWRNRDRSRSRSSANRYRSNFVDARSHHQLTREKDGISRGLSSASLEPGVSSATISLSSGQGTMFIDHTSLDARSQLDHHGELRLDVDSMSYEELLALGERIGSVSTGLSTDQLSTCLKESIYLPSELACIEERCVICLEEYQSMEQVGSLGGCAHVYHSECIKKWLSMKNLCPICKAPALPDNINKEKMKAEC